MYINLKNYCCRPRFEIITILSWILENYFKTEHKNETLRSKNDFKQCSVYYTNIKFVLIQVKIYFVGINFKSLQIV